MNKKTKRVLTLIIIVVVVLLALFGYLDDVLDFLGINDVETSPQETAVHAVETSAAPTATPEATSNALSSSTYGGPVLPTDDFSGMDLFEDGMAEVKLDFGIDGDTAAFIVDGKSYHVRMLAIDTPEVDKNLRQLDPWGKAASSYTKSALANAHQIVLELDPDSDVFDKYGRLLAWVWVDGELHNYNVVEEGLAKVAYLYGDYLYTYEVQDAESMAKSQGIKIWGEKDPDYKY